MNQVQPLPAELRRAVRSSPCPASSCCPACLAYPEPEAGQPALPGLEGLGVLAGQARVPGDPELAAVAAELSALDADGARMAGAIRGALDMLLDGQHTGRYRWGQLHKTEKTHAGTLVEIALARTLHLADGQALDYTIAGADVDCKFSQPDGRLDDPARGRRPAAAPGPGQRRGRHLVGRPGPRHRGRISARRATGTASAALNERGRAAVCWLHARAPLQENALIRLPDGRSRRSSQPRPGNSGSTSCSGARSGCG